MAERAAARAEGRIRLVDRPPAAGALHHVSRRAAAADRLQQQLRDRAGPGVVAILHEEIHEVRLIPLDGRPHVGERHPSVAGRFTRPLGRRHARRRNDELP